MRARARTRTCVMQRSVQRSSAAPAPIREAETRREEKRRVDDSMCYCCCLCACDTSSNWLAPGGLSRKGSALPIRVRIRMQRSASGCSALPCPAPLRFHCAALRCSARRSIQRACDSSLTALLCSAFHFHVVCGRAHTCESEVEARIGVGMGMRCNMSMRVGTSGRGSWCAFGRTMFSRGMSLL